jgi:hypothetical protein
LLLARIAGNKALPADLRAQIVKRTDGIPLFVEEMTKAVRAHDSLAAIYADFAEGFDTPDLRDARVLINRLRLKAASENWVLTDVSRQVWSLPWHKEMGIANRTNLEVQDEWRHGSTIAHESPRGRRAPRNDTSKRGEIFHNRLLRFAPGRGSHEIYGAVYAPPQ